MGTTGAVAVFAMGRVVAGMGVPFMAEGGVMGWTGALCGWQPALIRRVVTTADDT
jgi:hypothetical protein